MRDICDATSFPLPSPGLSATLHSNKSIEPFSPKGSENITITTPYTFPNGLCGILRLGFAHTGIRNISVVSALVAIN